MRGKAYRVARPTAVLGYGPTDYVTQKVSHFCNPACHFNLPYFVRSHNFPVSHFPFRQFGVPDMPLVGSIFPKFTVSGPCILLLTDQGKI